MTEGVLRFKNAFGKTLPDEQSWKPILCALLLQSFSCLYLCLAARARLSEQPVSKALDACSLCGATERFIQSKKKKKKLWQFSSEPNSSQTFSHLQWTNIWTLLEDTSGPTWAAGESGTTSRSSGCFELMDLALGFDTRDIKSSLKWFCFVFKYECNIYIVGSAIMCVSNEVAFWISCI